MGEVFTKGELREAFPDTSQIDRRMRDLRDRGWRISTNREDPTLTSSEHRFVEMGAEVWKPGQSKAKTPAASLTAIQRREIFEADDYLCRVCGIAAGEVYEGSVETAQLDVARREVLKPGVATTTEMVTECRRCRVGGRAGRADLTSILGELEQMSQIERNHFSQWLEADRRDFSMMERLWGLYRTLPSDSRRAVREAVSPV
ncbi:hypothetical protein ACH4XT_13520 [Streptomyces avidinii]|uniref:hypothetical protein n=1 Tax=Streptomyces avidinii TaxID=1895 RepID=UPI0037BCCE1C